MIVVIDDERTFFGHVDHYFRTSDEALSGLVRMWMDWSFRYGDSIQLYLDHDLGENDDIMPVVEFLVSIKTNFIERIFVHTQNPSAADKMMMWLSPTYSDEVSRIPLPMTER